MRGRTSAMIARQATSSSVVVGQSGDGSGHRVAHDLVFHRPEEHVANRRDKADQNKNQKRRDQGKGSQFLRTQSSIQGLFQRSAVRGKNRAVIGLVRCA